MDNTGIFWIYSAAGAGPQGSMLLSVAMPSFWQLTLVRMLDAMPLDQVSDGSPQAPHCCHAEFWISERSRMAL